MSEQHGVRRSSTEYVRAAQSTSEQHGVRQSSAEYVGAARSTSEQRGVRRSDRRKEKKRVPLTQTISATSFLLEGAEGKSGLESSNVVSNMAHIELEEYIILFGPWPVHNRAGDIAHIL